MNKIIGLTLLLMLAANVLGDQTELYVVDVGPNRGPPYQVLKYDENGQNPEVFITQGLNRPQEILFLEDQGIAIVSSLAGNRITRHDIETGDFISNFATGISQPTRMKIGPDGLLYVLQWQGDGRVLRFNLDGTALGPFTSVGVNNSIGLDWDTQGNLYVSSFNGRFVRKFDTQGNDLGFFVNSNLQGPTNIWFDDSGDLLVMDWTGGLINRYDANGAFKSVFVPSIGQPEGLAFLPNGDILVGSGTGSSVPQYQSDGTFVKQFVTPGLGGLATPNGVTLRTISTSTFLINPGLNGSWANFDTLGQGFFLEVFPDINLVFLAWFTFDTTQTGTNSAGDSAVEKIRAATVGDDNHRWLTAQGNFSGNVASLTVNLTQGGIFDDPTPTTNTPAGTMTLTFEDCTAGSLEYNFPDANLSGTVPLARIANDNVALCESLSGE